MITQQLDRELCFFTSSQEMSFAMAFDDLEDRKVQKRSDVGTTTTETNRDLVFMTEYTARS